MQRILLLVCCCLLFAAGCAPLVGPPSSRVGRSQTHPASPRVYASCADALTDANGKSLTRAAMDFLNESLDLGLTGCFRGGRYSICSTRRHFAIVSGCTAGGKRTTYLVGGEGVLLSDLEHPIAVSDSGVVIAFELNWEVEDRLIFIDAEGDTLGSVPLLRREGACGGYSVPDLYLFADSESRLIVKWWGSKCGTTLGCYSITGKPLWTYELPDFSPGDGYGNSGVSVVGDSLVVAEGTWKRPWYLRDANPGRVVLDLDGRVVEETYRWKP